MASIHRIGFSEILYEMDDEIVNAQLAYDRENAIVEIAKVKITPEQEAYNKENFGLLQYIPEDLRDRIVNYLPLSSYRINDCVSPMKIFWKAPPSIPAVFDSIDSQKFAKWLGESGKKYFSMQSMLISREDFHTMLPAVEYLEIRYDGVINFNPLDCKKITHLNLRSCTQLTFENLDSIQQLTTLTALNLSQCNQLRDESLEYLVTNLTRLKSLNLNQCEYLSIEGFKHLPMQLPGLTSLDLGSNNWLKSAAAEHIAKFTNLQSLALRCCSYFYDAGLSHLAKNLSELTSLEIACNGWVTSETVKHIAKFTKLCTLRSDDFGNDDLQHLTTLTALRSLDLYESRRLSNAGLEWIATLTQLTFLNLAGCRYMTAAGADCLAKKLPTLEIQRGFMY